MSDQRLGIGVRVDGVAQARAELAQLETSLKSIQDTASRLGSDISRQSFLRVSGADQLKAQIELLRATVGRWDAAAAALKSYDAAMQLHSRNISSVISATRGLSTAAEDFATRSTASIIRAQRGLDAYINTQERVRAVEERAIKRAEMLTTSRVIAGGRGIDRMEAQRERRVDRMIADMAKEYEAQQKTLFPGHDASAAAILRAQRGMAAWREEIDKTIDRIGRLQAVEDAAAKASTGFSLSGFMRGGRTPMSLTDEFMRGQRGAMVSTIGAGFKSAGGGAGVGLAAIGLTIGVAEIMQIAEQMGKLNEGIRATAETTGMSVAQFAKLQGELILTGSKADAADASIRHFASQLEKAMANPASEAAKALHAVGVSQGELVSKGHDTYAMLERVSGALNRFANDSTKAAFLETMFGRGDAAVAKFIERFKELGPQTAEYSNAIAKNNEAWIKVDESLNKLSLHWSALKANLAEPITVVINFVANGLDRIESVARYLVNLSAQAFDMRRFSGIGDYFSRVGTAMFQGPDTPIAQLPDVNVGAKADSRPHMQPFSVPKAGAGKIDKDITSDIAALRTSLQGLRHDYQLAAEQADAMFQHQRIMDRLGKADKQLSPMEAAKADYAAYQAAGQQKFAALADLQAKEDAVYDQMISKAAQVYDKEPKLYKQAVQEKINADKEFLVQHQKIQNEIDQHLIAIVDAHKKEVDELVKPITNAFDQVGTGLTHFLAEGISRSTTFAKAGQQLFQHTVSAGVNLVGDVASKIGGQLLGGKPGQGVGEVISSKIFEFIANQLTQIGLLSAIGINTGATAAAAAAGAVNPEIAGFKFALGGIVPSAAGGMVVGGGGTGGIPAIVHPREMVLPADISNHIISSMSGGGNTNLTYAPTMNGGRPFESRTESENFFRKHGNEMMNMARSMQRSRWRG